MGGYCYGDHYNKKHHCTGSALARYNHYRDHRWDCDSIFPIRYGYTPYACYSSHHCHKPSFWGSFAMGFLTSFLPAWLTSSFGAFDRTNNLGQSLYSDNSRYNTQGTSDNSNVNTGNKDTDTLAGFNNRFDQITKPGYTGSDTLDKLKEDIQAKIATQDDGVQNSNDIINYNGLLRAIELYEKNQEAMSQANQNLETPNNIGDGPLVESGSESGSESEIESGSVSPNQAKLDEIDDLDITNVTGYTDATEDDLATLTSTDGETASNVIAAVDVDDPSIGDVEGNSVSIENSGKTIKLTDNELGRTITYEFFGKTASGKIIYKDKDSDSDQLYILQKKGDEFYLMQYSGMDGAFEIAQYS